MIICREYRFSSPEFSSLIRSKIMIAKFAVVLASASPRRKELLAGLFDTFEIVRSTIDERHDVNESGRDLALRLAREKAEQVFAKRPQDLVIGCDTVVALGGVIFGKPLDKGDAIRMLTELSGKTHSVTTGVYLKWPGGESEFAEESFVHFRELTETEIENYVATGEPMDKAGAYAIQGGASKFVADLQGDYENVIGLPVGALKAKLLELHLAAQ